MTPGLTLDAWPARTLDAAGIPLPDDEDAAVRALAAELHLEVADLTQASPPACALVPRRWAQQFRVLPLSASDDRILIATCDPLDLEAERTLAFATGRSVEFALAGPTELARAVALTYGDADGLSGAPGPLREVQLLNVESEVAPPTMGDETGSDISRLVDDLVADGIAAGASDVHIEPEERGIAVRHRIDGVLVPVRTLPLSLARPLVSRIKIISGLDIADRLRPQDGRARIAVNGAAVDLRVSTLPASRGEKVVVRILDRRSALRSLDAMGFHEDEYSRIDTLLGSREGLILVTGPTGSGKTTTLYAALERLQQRSLNIVTVEDPIEYRIPGIVQVQVHERAGLTFASALRSIMRQDPDVLLVGEIRDRETAEIAIQASLTGHLVLSTLHTNDAASAVTRLVDFGVAPYKIATALKGVVAQRLVRRSCDEGYRGRLAIVEVLVADTEFAHAVVANAPVERLAESAKQAGMRSLWESGVAHVRAGNTTLEELLRVAAPPAVPMHEARPGPPSALPPGMLKERQVQPSYLQPSGLAVTNSPVTVDVGSIEVYIVHPRAEGWRILLLQRGQQTTRPGSWEIVTGTIESGERPEDAALREVREETGLNIDRLYCVAVQSFYLPQRSSIQMSVVFAGFVEQRSDVVLNEEHQTAEWLSVEDAKARITWPRYRRNIEDISELLAPGNISAVEDVLLIKR